MKKELTDKWSEAEETGAPISVGDIVVCDICDEDFTDSSEQGGFIFSSTAYCPKCAKEKLPMIRGYNEEHYIKARCPDDVSFADFVRDYRGPNAYIQITSSGK